MTVIAFPSVPEGFGVVGDPLGVGARGSPSTTSTSAGRPTASGLRVTVRMSAPSMLSRSMRGRPMVPLAGYQNHLLPSFSSVFSDIVSLLSWV
jgi:hypothetical protein